MNLQIRMDTTPLWICGTCDYTVLSIPDKPCHNCKTGLPKPDLSFIKEISRTHRTIRQVLQDSEHPPSDPYSPLEDP